jgi:type I restriction enzyme S subunit
MKNNMPNHQSKIEKLITQYCPKGVEFKESGELGGFYGGLSGKNKDDFSNGSAFVRMSSI